MIQVKIITFNCVLNLLFMFSTAVAEQIRYDNYHLFKLTPRNEQQLKIIQNFESIQSFDFWKRCNHIGNDCDLMVSPDKIKFFHHVMISNNITYNLSIPNIQELINQSISDSFSNHTMEWTNYHNLSVINQFLKDITMKFPNHVTLFNLTGESFEGRPIYGVKISYNKGNPGIFIEANMHAREWISSATATWLINELLTSKNHTIRHMAEYIDWYIVPVLNPDGFVFSHENNRMWRKTRQPHGKCIGADPNRNFNFLWMAAGASNDACSEIYAGPRPNSEPEIQALINYFDKIPKNNIQIYISIHSYGQMALTPWGHTNQEFPENYDKMLIVGRGFSNAAKLRYGTEYQYGASSVVLYNVSGSSKEWAYGVQGIPYTFTLELRDKGKYGFLLPPSEIIPTAEEFVDGLFGMIDSMPKMFL